MLTVKINDSSLERRIAEKARVIGKSTQEFVHELLNNALDNDDTELVFEKRNAKSNGYTIALTDDAASFVFHEDVEPYAYVKDSASYTEELRKKAWRK